MGKHRKLLVVVAVLLPAVAMVAESSYAQGFRRGGRRGGESGDDRPEFGRGGFGGDRGDFRRGGFEGDRGDFRRGGPPGDRPDFGRGGPRGERPGFPPGAAPGGGPMMGRRGMPSDIQGRMQRYEFFIGRLDTNGDGKIDPDEVRGPARGMLEGMARRAGLDPSKSITVDEFRKAMMRRLEQPRGDQAPDSSEDERPRAPEDQEPLVPGFGVQQNLPPVPGFGVRIAGLSLGGSTASLGRGSSGSSGSSSRSENAEAEERFRGIAQGIINRFDEDGSGHLEKNEWSRMRISPKPADRNNDDVITLEELTARFMQDRENRNRNDSSDSGGSGSWSGSNPSKRKSYRFLTPTERLPEGLPEWFILDDTNGDGQVSMDEYASVWSESDAEKFISYDVNNDGLITPRECLDVESREPTTESDDDRSDDNRSDDKPPTGGGFWWP